MDRLIHDDSKTVVANAYALAVSEVLGRLATDSARLDVRFARIGEVPSSSERKLMSAAYADSDRRRRLLAVTEPELERRRRRGDRLPFCGAESRRI